ncbi:MAG: SURF1 family protein [Pseudomonadota bacterium]
MNAGIEQQPRAADGGDRSRAIAGARAPLGWPGFRPGLPMTLFVIVMLPVLIALGRWQLDRAEQKLDAYAVSEAARSQVPLTVDAYGALSNTDRRFRTVSLLGQFDAERVLLLDNQVHNGRVGYWVLQRFQVAGRDEQFLVNRGFIAAPARRDLWPQVETPASPVEISGLLWPQLVLLPLLEESAALETAPGSTSGWPRRVQRSDFETFARWLPGLEPLELRLTGSSAGVLSAAAPADLPNGAPRHQGYAVQWFGLATVLMIGFVVFGRVNARERTSGRATESASSPHAEQRDDR